MPTMKGFGRVELREELNDRTYRFSMASGAPVEDILVVLKKWTDSMELVWSEHQKAQNERSHEAVEEEVVVS